MTEYWVSTKKHYCEICKCWLSANKLNIRNHEKSAKHLENFRKLLKESSARKEQETQDKQFLEKELKKLEKVEKQYLASSSKNENLNKNIENENKITNTSNKYFSSVPTYPLKPQHPVYDAPQNESNKNEMKNNESNWLVMIDEDTGRLVYLNKLNNEMKHKPPKNFSQSLPKEEAFTEQNGWHRYFDFYFNNFYYYNANTSQYIWQYSSTNINNFTARLEQWENMYASNNSITNYPYYNSSNNIYANYNQPNYNTGNYEFSENIKENEMTKLTTWHTQGQKKEEPKQKQKQKQKKEEKTGNDKEKMKEKEKKRNELKQPENFYLSLNLIKQASGTEAEKKRTNQINSEIGVNNILMEEIKKKTVEKEQKMDSGVNTNTDPNTNTNINASDINDIHKVKADENNTEYIKNDKGKEQETMKKKRVSRWDQRYVQTEEEKDHGKEKQLEKEETRDNNSITKEQKEMIYEIPKKIMKLDSVKDIEVNNLDEQNEKNTDETIGAPGKWEAVENTKVHTIPNASVEEIFYKVKSREEIEKEELLKLEENIKDEYSMYNEFYIKKKELENPDLFLNQEFQFVNKPVFIKATDRKNLEKEKVTFAKRTIKAKNKKGDISNAN